MQRLHRPMQRLHRRPLPPGSERRRGAVLVVVLGLLGLLMFLGFAFYTFARQEEGNAEYFNASASVVEDPGLSPDLLFDFSLRQLIVGAREDEPNSALWGGRHSLVPNMFGRDLHPFSGRGVNVIDNSGLAAVDQNYDGIADGSAALLNFNDSPAARGGATSAATILASRPDPDIDYTYPDVNNLFLAFRGYGTNLQNQPVPVIIPSFHQPQLLRQFSGGSIQPITNWWANAATATRVLRAHASHQFINDSGAAVGPRYSGFPMPGEDPVTGNDPNGNGVFGEQGVWSIGPWQSGRTYQANEIVVPFNPGDRILASRLNVVFRATATTATGAEPTWFSTTAPPAPSPDAPWQAISLATTAPSYEYDADADGDGIKEAVWLDLDFPVQTMNDGTDRKFVPMFAFTVYDAAGLLNLLSQGNIEGTINFRSGGLFGAGDFLHQSNMGVTTAETNPLYGLSADPIADRTNPGDLDQLRYFFGHQPVNWGETANMEWFLSRVGRAQYQDAATVTDFFPGVYGSDQPLPVAGNPTENDLTMAAARGLGSQFPRPGRFGFDDNRNREGGEYQSLPTVGGRLRAYGHPLDFRGVGSYTSDATAPGFGALLGKTIRTAVDPAGPSRFIQYLNFPSRGDIRWGQYAPFAGPGDLMRQTLGGSQLSDTLLDEPFEVSMDYLNPLDSDTTFGASESGFLQMADLDVSELGLSARTRSLLEYNFWTNQRAQEIRRKFTTVSADLKSFGKTYYGGTGVGPERDWEFMNVGSGIAEFPPYFTTTLGNRNPAAQAANEPFRPALREALKIRAADRSTQDVLLRRLRQRVLNLNGVLYNAGTAARVLPMSRPLTDHPIDPGTGDIQPLTGAEVTAGHPATRTPPREFTDNSMNPNPARFVYDQTLQEQWARYDRQLLARDIYVMLYTLGGGRDDVNYTTANTISVADPMDPMSAKTELPLHRQQDLNGNGKLDDGEIRYQRLLYDDDQLAEMAQFAINVVNQLDRDHVLDAFEYDRNLADGWNLDDEPYSDLETVAGGGSMADADRGVVYGVEQQELTFSEALAVRSFKFADNTQPELAATPWHDHYDHYWTFLELRNAAPYGTSINGSWQIEVEVPNPNGGGAVPAKRFLTLEKNATVPAGDLLTIRSRGDNQKDTLGMGLPVSEIAAALGYDSMGMAPPTMVQVVPKGLGPVSLDVLQEFGSFDLRNNAGGTSQNPSPAADPAGMGYSYTYRFVGLFDESNGNFTVGANANAMPSSMTFRLKRRVHANRSVPAGIDPEGRTADPTVAYNQDNPWVVVDEMTITTVDSQDTPTRGGIVALRLDPNDKNGWDIKHQLVGGTPGNTTDSDPMVSFERDDRLDRTDTGVYQVATGLGDVNGDAADGEDRSTPLSYKNVGPNTDFSLNTFGARNSRTKTAFQLTQAQFDRDFASVSELLAIPTYGPDEVTMKTDKLGRFTAGVRKFLRPVQPNASYGDPLTGDGEPGAKGTDDGGLAGVIDDADERGLGGDDPKNIIDPHLEWLVTRGAINSADIPNTTKFDNRWYRLLGFWEMPTLMNGFADQRIVRQTGELNPNTFRYPASLAGLIDDTTTAFSLFNPIRGGQNQVVNADQARFGQDANDSLGDVMPDGDRATGGDAHSPEPYRDWWFQFLLSRDGIDNSTGMILPGVAGSQPFRSLNFTADGINSIEHTLLRALPKAAGKLNFLGVNAAQGDALPATGYKFDGLPQRHLFELQSRNEYRDPNVSNKPDFIGRNRLLSKVLNNTTTRSNVFFVFVKVDYFEVDDSAGYPQIKDVDGDGQVMLPESPGHRGFFIIDRSLAFDLLKNVDFNTSGSLYTLDDTFPYRQLVIHRQTIE